MDGEVPEPAPAEHGGEFLKGVEIGDARLKMGVNNLFEEIGAGGEDDNRKGDTAAAELEALDGVGHGEVVGAGALHHGGEFHGPVAVGVGLDEHEQPGLRLQ